MRKVDDGMNGGARAQIGSETIPTIHQYRDQSKRSRLTPNMYLSIRHASLLA